MFSMIPLYVPLPVPFFFFDHGGDPKDVDHGGGPKVVGVQGEKEVNIVYPRKGKENEQDKDKEQDKLLSQTPSQEASLDPFFETSIVPSLSVSPSNTSFDDINVPIAICKGVSFCT